MKIRVNGRDRETSAATLDALLAELADKEGLRLDAIAVAVNGDFAPAAERGARRLEEGDAVEIVSPRQGG